MASTLVAYYESQDTSAVLSHVAAVIDQHVNTDGDDVTVPSFAPNLVGVFMAGSDITQGRITSPTLRKRLQLDVLPLNDGADEPTSPQTWLNKFDSPMPLTPGEDMRADVAEDAAGADAAYVGVWLEGEKEAVPAGEIHSVRCTGATTVTANAWSLVPLTFTQQLEAGRWAIVGMRAESATCVLARLVIPGSSHRPGVMGCDTWGDIQDPIFRNGGIGKLGEFSHTNPPQAEFLCTAGDTAEVVILDLVKVA